MADINEARKIINECDAELARIFERRMGAVREVARYKKERGLPVTDAAREAEVLQRNGELISDETLRGFFVSLMKDNMEVSKRYQRLLLSGQRVAYSGVPGAFAEIAAKRIFPDGKAVPCPDFRAAFEAAESGECDCAVLPIENSLGGDVGQVMDLAFFGTLFINGVYEAQIEQDLLAVDGAALSDIKKVISHPQALGQCAGFIRSHGFETEECVNTAVAAERVAASGDRSVAAIGSAEAAERYGLTVLQSRVNESGRNSTRFAVFSRAQRASAARDNRFIMLFTVKNEPGSLGKAVSAIGENGFNLLALKSRPTKELSWSYYFYAEGEGRIDSFEGRRMLAALAPVCMDVKVLGSYEKEATI